MTKEYSIAEVRNRLSEIIHQAEDGENITLTRRGRPVAVLLAHNTFQRLITPATPNLWDAIQKFRSMTDFTDGNLSDNEIVSWRDREPGRNFSWRN